MGSQVLYDSPTTAIGVTEAQFTDAATGLIPTDPASVTLVLTDPTGTITNFTYTGGSGIGHITRVSAGSYTLEVDGLNVAGLYSYTWVGAGGGVQQVFAGTFRLMPLNEVGLGLPYWYTGMEELKSWLNLSPSDKNYHTFDFEMQTTIHCVSNWINRFCVVPETPVLTADLRWVPAGSLQVGDELVGTDEHPVGPRYPKRNFRRSVVAAVPRRMAACTKITLSDGREVISAADHRWLGRTGRGKNGTVYRWLPACTIQPGYEISAPLTPWPDGDTFEDGWMSGVLDGEGWLHSARPGDNQRNGTGAHVGVAQNPGAVLSKAEQYLKDRGIPYGFNSKKHCQKIEVYSRAASMEVLGRLQPVRLMPRSHEVWEGGQVTGSVSVVSVEPAGVREVVSLGTSTGTYIANGLVSHNCGRHFYQLQETRTYMPDTIWELTIDDLVASKAGSTVVNLDYDGDGVFETAWGNPAPPAGTGTLYQLKIGSPANYADNWNVNAFGGVARPYTQLQALMIPGAIATNGAWLPFVWPYSHLNRVQVIGTWGWDYVPPEVQRASLLLCQDLYKSKDTPWGMAGSAETGLLRIQSNPWIVELLRPYIRADRKWGV